MRRNSNPVAGLLRCRVQFVRRVDAPAPDMAAISQDEVICERWAELADTGAVYWGTAQIESRATHWLKLRAEPGLTDPRALGHGVLARIDGQDYRISRAAFFDERHRWTRLELVELGETRIEGQEFIEEVIDG